MSQSTTVQLKDGVQFETGLTTMSIRVDNGNPLDMSVAESLCECYEVGVKQVDIIDALNALRLSKKK